MCHKKTAKSERKAKENKSGKEKCRKNPETANNYWASRYEVYRANTRHSKCFKNWYANVQKEEQKERTRSWRYYDDPDLKYTAYAVTEEYIDYVEDEYGEYEHIDC